MKFTHPSGAIDVDVQALIVAGWTGRDTAAVQHHIDELAEIGVAPPSTTPLFYRVARDLLTQAEQIEVVGSSSSGEAEPLLIHSDGTLWIGLASDHTDRELEAASVAASKQACAKVCASTLWAFTDVIAHLDQIELRSWIEEDGDWRLYQSGTLAAILPLDQLVRDAPLAEGAVMLCGTLPAIGGVRPAHDFRAELCDPVLGRSLMLEYRTQVLPVIS